MRKRAAALLLSALLTLPAIGLCACGGGGYDYEITVWVGEGTKTLTEKQIGDFNETNEAGIKFKATVLEVSESVAAGDAIGNPSAADIACFAQDQEARLVRRNALSPLGTTAAAAVREANDADSVAALTLGGEGGTLWGFPLTSDNGYIMYYDKSVIAEEDVSSLEALIADCEAAGRNFAMNLTETGGGWYTAAFFYATGCRSEWPTDDGGSFLTTYEDDFNSENGLIAAQGMKKLLDSTAYLASDKASTFGAAIPSAVVVSGIWDYNTAKRELGENLGIAPLPSFTVDGESYTLKTYLGHKFMGIKPQTDAYRALYLQQLATYLTSEKCQLERFEAVGWGPSNLKAQENEAVKGSEALRVLAESNIIPQGQYPTDWWASVVRLSQNIQNSEADALNVPLGTYESSLAGLLSSNN